MLPLVKFFESVVDKLVISITSHAKMQFFDNRNHEGIIALSQMHTCEVFIFCEVIDILYHKFNGSLSSDKEQKLNTFSVSFAS